MNLLKVTYLAVEGVHDVEFVGALLRLDGYTAAKKRNQVPEDLQRLIPEKILVKPSFHDRVPLPSFFLNGEHVVIIEYSHGGGPSKLAETAEAGLRQLRPIAAGAVGLVLDADSDTSATDRYAELRKLLSDVVQLPAAVGTVDAGPPRCGGFVMPDCSQDGTLEDVLLQASDKVYSKATAEAREYVENFASHDEFATSPRQSIDAPSGRKKATLSIVGSLIKPATAIQNSIRDSLWVSDVTKNESLVARSRAFFQDLMR